MTQHLDDAVKQSLSALMDDEHTELDLQRVLKSAHSDDSTLDAWNRMLLARQVLRAEKTPLVREGFAASVRAAIDEEGELYSEQATMTRALNKLRYTGGKVAVAACFTFAFLLGAYQFGNRNGLMEGSSLAQQGNPVTNDAVVPAGFEMPPLNARTVSTMPNSGYSANSNAVPVLVSAPLSDEEKAAKAELQARLTRMMFKHEESASANGGLGMLPLMRVSSVKNENE